MTTLPTAPPCTVTATITTLTPDAITAAGGSQSQPDVELRVEDENRYVRLRWESTTDDVE